MCAPFGTARESLEKSSEKGSIMTRLSAPEQRRKYFWTKLAVTGAVLTVPIAVLAAPASADTVNHDVTQADNSWYGDQGAITRTIGTVVETAAGTRVVTGIRATTGAIRTNGKAGKIRHPRRQ